MALLPFIPEALFAVIVDGIFAVCNHLALSLSVARKFSASGHFLIALPILTRRAKNAAAVALSYGAFVEVSPAGRGDSKRVHLKCQKWPSGPSRNGSLAEGTGGSFEAPPCASVRDEGDSLACVTDALKERGDLGLGGGGGECGSKLLVFAWDSTNKSYDVPVPRPQFVSFHVNLRVFRSTFSFLLCGTVSLA